MSNSLAISGPTELTAERQRFVAINFGERLKNVTTIVSGAAYGVDTVGAVEAWVRDIQLILTVPAGCWHNTGLYKHEDALVKTVMVQGGYMKRNDATAEQADALIAYPPSSQEELRSGTWATVRRFRKLGKPVTIVPLG